MTRDSKKAADPNPPRAALEGSHKSSLTLSQLPPILQSPFTNIAAGNMPAVFVSDLRWQGGQNYEKSFPKSHLA